jgi:DNA-binding response OmpR family regulator
MNQDILIVDDDASILMLLSDVLSENGLNVYTAGSGEAGLRLIEERCSKLIILEFMMTGIRRAGVCKKIRSCIRCPILLLSARTPPRISEVPRLGADDYLTSRSPGRALSHASSAICGGKTVRPAENSPAVLKIGVSC